MRAAAPSSPRSTLLLGTGHRKIHAPIRLQAGNHGCRPPLAALIRRRHRVALALALGVDLRAIDAAIAQVIAANPDKVAEYKSGKDKLFGFFVGQVMKTTGGKANPAMVNDILKKQLG